MKRYLPVILLVIAVGLFIGCGGKEEEGDNGELTGPGKFESFEKAVAETKTLADYAVLKKDKELATSAAETAEASWEDVKTNFPAEPPARFEGDTEWAERVDTLIRLTGDVGEQAAAEDFDAAEASIREIQKQLLDLDDMNKISTAGDEVIRLLILTDQLIVAFEEDRDEDSDEWPVARVDHDDRGLWKAIFGWLFENLATVAVAETEQADTRSWVLLPAEIWMVRIPVLPGEHEVMVQALDGSEPISLGRVRVARGEKVFRSARFFGGPHPVTCDD